MMRFPTGTGTARSTAFQGCQPQAGSTGDCVPFGASSSENAIDISIDMDATGDTDGSTGEPSEIDNSNLSSTSDITDSSGGGAFGFSLLWLTVILCFQTKRTLARTGKTSYHFYYSIIRQRKWTSNVPSGYICIVPTSPFRSKIIR